MNKDEKIESILESLNGIEKSSPKPFFFARLDERMKSTKNETGAIVRLLSRPAVAVAAVITIIIINSYAIFFLTKPAVPETKNNTTEIASSMDEYAQLSPNFYDPENPNP